MNNVAKCLFACLCLILLTSNSWAQNKKIKFGKVSKEELEMKVYDQDTSASAVILYDNGRSYFKTRFINDYSEFVCIFERHVRIKILKPEGFKYANFDIPIYNSSKSEENLGTIKARSFNLDGKVEVDKLERKSVFREKSSPNWTRVKFSMPNIKEGTVIDCKYIITSPFYQNFRSWQFQYDIPVVYSKYLTRIPNYFDYQKTMKGYYPISQKDEGGRSESFVYKYRDESTIKTDGKAVIREFSLSPISSAYSYYAHNIPAFKSEDYMLAEKNYLSAIEFELQSYQIENGIRQTFTSAWKDVQKKLMKYDDFGGAIKKIGFTKNIIAELTNESQSEIEKTSLLFHTVKHGVRWNKQYGLFCKNT